MSVDEWRKLERNSTDVKHEYIDGRVYAMSGGSLAHSSIAINAVRVLQDALRASGKGCYTYNSDVAACLSSKRYTYPDTSGTCDERDKPSPDTTEIQAPRVIVEVLSDSTEAYDRGRKLGYYRACPTIEEYVLVASKYQSVEVYRRTQQGWIYDFYGPEDEIELVSLSVKIVVAVFYRDAGVPVVVDELEGNV
jgi:Uma2 family endonuclease